MATFKIELRETCQISVIGLKGYLDAHTAPELENTFLKFIDEKKYNVIVNCKDLSYISSAGLGVLMAFIEDFRKNNGDIKLSNMSAKIFNVFDLLGFPLLYDIAKDEEDAIKKFNIKK